MRTALIRWMLCAGLAGHAPCQSPPSSARTLDVVLLPPAPAPQSMSGELDYWFSYGKGFIHKSASVVDGRATLPLPDELEVLDLGRVVLGGRNGFCRYRAEGSSAAGSIQVKAEWLPSSTIRVLAQHGRRELANLEVWQGSPTRWDGYAQTRPDSDCVLIGDDIQSPFDAVPLRYASNGRAWSPIQRWFVRTPAHQWAYVDIDHTKGGQVELRLGGLGTLEVALARPAISGVVQLSVCRLGLLDDYAAHQSVSNDASMAVFTDVPAGTYVVRAAIEAGGRLRVLPPALAELRDHWTTRVPLLDTNDGEHWTPLVADRPSSLRVSMAVDASWNWTVPMPCRLIPRLPFIPLDEKKTMVDGVLTEDANHRWRATFDAGPGDYQFVVPGLSLAIDVTQEASGTELVSEVLSPCELDLRCAGTSGLIEGCRVCWQSTTTVGSAFLQSKSELAGPDGMVKVRAPQGPLEVLAFKAGYLMGAFRFTVERGAEVHDLHLVPSQSLRIGFRSGEFKVNAPVDFAAEVKDVDGSGRVLNHFMNGASHVYELSSPGTYRVSPGSLRVSRDLQPQDVRVVAGDVVEHDFRLVLR